MKKTFLIVAALVSFTAFAFVGDVLAITEITIDVAPNVLNLQRPGDYVTVHTDIPFDYIDCSSVVLEAKGDEGTVTIMRYYCKSDDRGYFVAKFLMEDVRILPLTADMYNALTLKGTTKATADSVDFSGTQEILVIDNDPKGP